MQFPQARSRLDAELGDQHVAGAPVGGQRIGLPPALVQSEHQQGMRVLAQRVGGGEPLQLGDQFSMAAQVKVRLEPRFSRLHPQLRQPRHLDQRKRIRFRIRQRLPAP